jgi:hypothetical protein
MPRFYVAQPMFQGVGNIDARVNRVIEQANEPALLRWQYSRRVGERHLLLLIEADDQQAALGLARPILDTARRGHHLPFINRPPVAFHEAERGNWVDDGTPLPEPDSADDAGDPFADLPDGPGASSTFWPACDRLLEWMSAAGSGSWEMFARVARQLGAAASTGEARWLLRRLRLLSHVETKADGKRWCVTPPALVRSPSGDIFFCGGRTQSMRRPLSVIEENQPEGPAPSCWVVHAAHEVQNAPPFGGEAAAAVAPHLPDKDSWPGLLLQRVPHLNPPSSAERWTGTSYQLEAGLRIQGGQPVGGPTGLYRLRYDDRARSLTVFIDRRNERMWTGDWESLRFLMPRARVLPPRAQSRREGGRAWLVVARSDRWPLLHERVLVLCSGLLPRRQEDLLWYRDVPAKMADVLCALLGVELTIEA